MGDPLVLEDNWRRFQEADGDIRSRLAQLSAAADRLESVAKTTEQHWSGIAEEVGAARRLWGTGAVAAGLAGGKDPYADTVWNRLRIIKETMADGLVAVTADGRRHVREADRRQAIVPPILVTMVLAALGAGLISGRRLSRRVVSPLSRLREAAGHIRDGDLDRPVDIEPSAAQEATELAVAMSDMAAGLSRIQDQLRHQAFHDPLTGLANRALLTDRLNHALARRQRSGRLFGLLLLDLDDFKSINDSLGHWAGDALLVNIADRLARCTRESDTLARLGGDEFAILLEDVADPNDAVQVAERILEEISGVFSFDGRAFPVSASIGIALAEPGGVAVDDLIRDADVAMYITKSNGKGSYTLFERGMHVAVKERLQLKSDLAQALGTDQLTLHYQPIVDLRQTLQLQTVAEGVERGGQADELRRHDCDMAQGYFYARLTSRDDLLALLRDGSTVRRPVLGRTDDFGLNPHEPDWESSAARPGSCAPVQDARM